ncbi:glycosyl hydrolase family 28-related protein [Carnobacterium pleistocenium]|uniref:glycosyl hydrolase family 28-related protein n=1 Tax=Carnobacterium pleistocenium TaxID=181073 RepID=UPI0005502157|nr:glycosyl hydrolase family 28-related protein [Carnobacterium pleistocenium]
MATINVMDYGAVGDGITDDTTAIRRALSAGNYNTIEFPAGTFLIKGTLSVNSGTTFKGAGIGLTKLKLGDGYSLDEIYFRDTNISPIIVTKTLSQEILFQDFTLTGNTKKLLRTGWGMGGIIAQNTAHVRFERVRTEWINITDDLVGYAYGFGITSIDADDIVYSFCEGEYAGYQNFGFFDRTTNSKMLDSFSGMGHRTSSQIHRSCDNIEVLRNRIIQTANPGSLEPHGAFTIHGRSGGEEASNILLEDNVIEMTGGYKSALQAFQASLNLTARRNTIKSNGEGIRLGSGKGALFENNTLISQKEAGLELEYGNIGINVIEGSDAVLKSNSYQGFDTNNFADSTSIISAKEDTQGLSNDLYFCKIYQNINGQISEVKSVVNVDGEKRIVRPIIKY